MAGSKLLLRDAEYIRLYAEFGFTPSQLARSYGVHPDTIRNIVKGTSYKTDRGGRSRYTLRKLSDEQVRAIRDLAAAGHKEHAISNRIGKVVSRSTIRQIVTGKTYQDVV